MKKSCEELVIFLYITTSSVTVKEMDSMKILLAAMLVRLPPLMKTPRFFMLIVMNLLLQMLALKKVGQNLAEAGKG